MKIEEGKFYMTRDGRKVGPIVKSQGFAKQWPFTVEHDFSSPGIFGKAWKASGSFSSNPFNDDEETEGDLIAEWQDEPEKEILDMSEVKFKVGDYVEDISSAFPPENRGFVAAIDGNQVRICWDGHGQSMEEAAEENCLWPNDEFKLVKSASIPEPNTKWVFNDGQDFVVRVVGFNDKGQIVLETLSDEGSYDLGEYFSFEGGNDNFGHFYNPWVEKVEEPKQLVGYVRVVKSKINGRLDFDVDLSDTEQEARDGFDSWDGAWELVDVVKVEWSE